eukprot:525120-Amphidinium_carterae.1
MPPLEVGRNCKMTQIIDQAAETDFEVMSDVEVRKLFDCYDQTQGGRPHPSEEPTTDQLSALRHLLAGDSAPYTDFVVWTPYGKNQSKMLKTQAQIFINGEL